MNAAAPQFGATGLVHLRDKDILSSVSRKFSGLPDEAARWFREFSTFMDKHDLGPYKDNTVSVLVNDFHVVSDPHTLPDVPHAGWPGPTGPLPFSSGRVTTSATTASAPPNADAISMDDLAVTDTDVSTILNQANIADFEEKDDADSTEPTSTGAGTATDGFSSPSGSGPAAAPSVAVSQKQTATFAPPPAPPMPRDGPLPSLYAPHPPTATSSPGAFARSGGYQY